MFKFLNIFPHGFRDPSSCFLFFVHFLILSCLLQDDCKLGLEKIVQPDLGSHADKEDQKDYAKLNLHGRSDGEATAQLGEDGRESKVVHKELLEIGCSVAIDADCESHRPQKSGTDKEDELVHEWNETHDECQTGAAQV